MTLKRLNDQAARSSAIARTGAFETMQLLLRDGKTIPPHPFPTAVTLSCIEGAAVLTLGGERRALNAGDWLYLEAGSEFGLAGAPEANIVMTVLFDSAATPSHKPSFLEAAARP